MIAVVTGASSGFGKAISQKLTSSGIKVIGVARRKEILENLKAEIGANFFPLVLDITDQKKVEQAFSSLPEDWKSIDILVNNAGMASGRDLAQKANITDWDQMVKTNINGLLYCTHAVLPGMVTRNFGQIVNIGSVAGDYAYPGGNVYGASKAFVKQFSLNLRADLLGTAIRVTDIEPGLCGGTEFSKVRFKGDMEKVKSLYEGTDPLLPADIAETVSWVINLPARVNINFVSMMPVCQAFAALAIDRKKKV